VLSVVAMLAIAVMVMMIMALLLLTMMRTTIKTVIELTGDRSLLHNAELDFQVPKWTQRKVRVPYRDTAVACSHSHPPRFSLELP
jgi:hypothetical protein